MAKRLKVLNSEIVNVKISSHFLKDYHLPTANLSYAAYFRYFIPQYVTEKRALYLDSDMMVTMDLNPLFSMDLASAPLAAVEDVGKGQFNSGVMLIDVEK